MLEESARQESAMRKSLLLTIAGTGCAGGVIGFLAGIYALPLIIEWRAADDRPAQVVAAAASDPTGRFDRDSPGSDALHWGEGTIRVSESTLVFENDVKLAPGPDYRIYLTKKFAETQEEFNAIKPQAIEIAKLRTFSGPLSFALPADVDHEIYDNVTVWCEAFGMYIASARLE